MMISDRGSCLRATESVCCFDKWPGRVGVSRKDVFAHAWSLTLRQL